MFHQYRVFRVVAYSLLCLVPLMCNLCLWCKSGICFRFGFGNEVSPRVGGMSDRRGIVLDDKLEVM